MKMRFALLSVASVALISISSPASAGTGCNGVINPLVWGCAPWDNNNGPKYPYFKKTQITIPQAKAELFNHNGIQMVRDLRNGAVHPVIAAGGGNVVAAGGAN